jgi:glycosyltransferase involved in cell wall biosynthesis
MLRALLFNKLLTWISALCATTSLLMLVIRYRMSPGASRRQRGAAPLRVLFLHRDLPFHGGVPRCLLYLARATDRERIDFRVGTFKEPSHRMVEAFTELGIKPLCLGDQGYISPSKNLREIVREEGIDIIVATSFKAYLCAKAATARSRDVRVVFWIHAVRGPVEGPLRKWLLAILSKHDPMLFVSRAVQRVQLPQRHRGASKVIYNGVEDIEQHCEYQPYPLSMRSTFGVQDKDLVLAYTAEFIYWKDHQTAISAVHELARRGINAKLLLVGAGELIDKCREQAASGAGAANILFLGARSDARRILGLVDIYIHPSRGEGFGLAVVEAMLAARPVVAARDGALVEYISQGQTGMLFRPGDPVDLADAIVALAQDRQRAAGMGAAARDYCVRTFGIDGFADAITEFLEQAHPQAARHREMVEIEVEFQGEERIAPAHERTPVHAGASH